MIKGLPDDICLEPERDLENLLRPAIRVSLLRFCRAEKLLSQSLSALLTLLGLVGLQEVLTSCQEVQPLLEGLQESIKAEIQKLEVI